MMANNPYKLENMLIRSYAHFRSLELNAYFKATKDLHFDGLPNEYINRSMTRMQGSQYLMHANNLDTYNSESYCLDIDTLKARRLKLANFNICFIEGDYILVVRYFNPILILRDLEEIGQIEFYAKYENCKYNQSIDGRYAQQTDDSVYALNHDDLYRIKWQDIKDSKYRKRLVKSNVKNFYVDGRLGLATINTDRTLSLPTLTEVDLKAKVCSEAIWTIVSCIANFWIASGHLDSDGKAVMASISKKGKIISALKLKLTSNGNRNRDGIEFAGIFTLHQAYVRGRRGIIFAIERDGCCHLISVDNGRMSKLQSIDSIAPVDVIEGMEFDVVLSVTATVTKGEFIAGGYGWTKRITLKLK